MILYQGQFIHATLGIIRVFIDSNWDSQMFLNFSAVMVKVFLTGTLEIAMLLSFS